MNQGRIELIYGPMFSGKTSEMIRRLKRHQHAQKKCLIINYSKDNRYSSHQTISTHDQITMQAQKVEHLHQLDNIISNYDVIAIDEAHFFDDVAHKCDLYANSGKVVIVAALDGTFERKPFKNILHLIPQAECVTKLTSVCVDCYEEASFTRRKTDDKEIELIGGDEIYKPVCRKCYFL